MKIKHKGSWLIAIAGGLARAFGTIVTWCLIGMFVVITVVSILWKMEHIPLRGLDIAAASLPSSLYADMLGMEIPFLTANEDRSAFSPGNVASVVTRLTTGINPHDPRTFAAGVLPGARMESGVVVIRGIGTGPEDHPVEVAPSPEFWQDPLPSAQSAAEGDDPPVQIPPVPEDAAPGGNTSQPELPDPDEAASSDEEAIPEEPPPNVVFVYHSHPEESFLPELDGVSKIDQAFDKTDKSKTVAAIGARLVESLDQYGIGALHSDQYYPWDIAYNESRKTVKKVMQEDEDVSYFIDIHRDSARIDKTKLVHNGESYAKLYFVIGQKNPNYKQNQELAAKLHQRVEEKVTGLSRGVFLKHAGSNGEFNQSLSPNSILVEVGGVDNTLEECFRTIDVLAEAIAEIYWERSETIKASAPGEAVPYAGTIASGQ